MKGIGRILRRVIQGLGQRQFLRLGLRRRVVRALFPLESVSSESFTVPYYEYVYTGDLANAQEWQVYFFGGYELKEMALLRDLLSRMGHAVVFDIGANLGGHALAMASMADRIYAFEPYGPLADRIEQRAEENGLKNIVVNRFGLANDDSESRFYLDTESRNSGTGSFVKDHAGAKEVGLLPLRKGDDWSCGRRPDLVKIDIEGYEALALLGLRKTLQQSEPLILMEVTETSARLLEECGGLSQVLPYEFDLYEVCSPRALLLVFTFRMYRLEPRATITARGASFNVLIVPRSRRDLVTDLE